MSRSIFGERRFKHMSRIPFGTFLMGSESFYPEERPVHRVRLDSYWIDEHPVTVAEFRPFVHETGYVTTAEHAPEAALYPNADPKLLVPGSRLPKSEWPRRYQRRYELVGLRPGRGLASSSRSR
jgi:formylglycine-generating enzyme required for sulfatase activity